MARIELQRGVAILVGRARWLAWLLPGHAVLAVLVTGAIVVAGPQALGSSPAIAITFGLASLAMVVLLLATLVLAGMWTYRANANLHAAGADGLSFTPGWAVGWHFVPFANLVRPFEALREIWNRSRLEDDTYLSDHAPTLRWWWGCWIIGSWLSNIGAFRDDPATAPVRLVGEIVLLGSALLFARIIRETTQMQHERLTNARVFD